MAITLELDADLEGRLRAEADKRGMTLEEYIAESLCMSAEICHRRTPFVDDRNIEPGPDRSQ